MRTKADNPMSQYGHPELFVNLLNKILKNN